MAQSGKDNSAYGEPERWEFDYPFEQVQTGFWLWAMSGFQRLPNQDEVSKYDKMWISDMKLAYQLYSFMGNQSPVMKLFEEHTAYTNNPASYNATRNAVVQGEQLMQNMKRVIGA